jgi:hypothetical protein
MLAVLAASLLVLAWLAVPGARAETLSATCSNLQSKINAAAAKPQGGTGVTVALSGMCNASALGISTGVTVPGGANFTLEGAPGTTSGLDGAGVTKPLLANVTSEQVDIFAIVNMTFQHANVSSGAAGGVALNAARLTLMDDHFVEDVEHAGAAGALYADISPGSCATTGATALTIEGSTFSGNEDLLPLSNTGGAAWLDQNCPASTITLRNNVFTGNTVNGDGSGDYVGGGLSIWSPSAPEKLSPVLQSGNVFAGNRVIASSGVGNYGGGGEWLSGIELTSVGDRFSGNSVAGTTGAHWSWGGGLGIINNSCNEHTPTQSMLEDDVIAGNSLGAGEAADLGGGGIYVGCGPSTTLANHLTLLDSTVTENSVATSGGIAGIDGHPNDQLTMANSIVARDSGGPEIGGFNGEGGSLSSSYSDVCDAAGTAPLPGTGNICANPLLADDGNPSSFDVHETSLSPTIDAGSNALVPSGLGSDFFGQTRVQSGHAAAPACTVPGASLGYVAGPAVVDMGASEYGPLAIPAIAFVCPGVKPGSAFAWPSVSTAHDLLGITFKSLPAGRLSIKATYKRTRIVTKLVKGHRRRVHQQQTLTFGTATRTVGATGAVTVKLKPTRAALAYLKTHRRVSVTLAITFTVSGAPSSTQHKTIVVRYAKPAHG